MTNFEIDEPRHIELSENDLDNQQKNIAFKIGYYAATVCGYIEDSYHTVKNVLSDKSSN